MPDPQKPISRKFIEERIPLLLTAMEEGADRIDKLVQDLKDFARQNHDEKSEDIDLRQIIQSALRINRKYIETHTTKFDLILPESIPCIQGIPHRLEQVVVNLLHNACDALSDPYQRVGLEVRSEKNTVKLIVEDEGCGMDEETSRHLFEPFFTTKDSNSGMGMGMTVVKNIVDQHNALLDVETSLGTGTRFTITFTL